LCEQLGISACFSAVFSPMDAASAGRTHAKANTAPAAADIPKRMTHLIFKIVAPSRGQNPVSAMLPYRENSATSEPRRMLGCGLDFSPAGTFKQGVRRARICNYGAWRDPGS
jgi:hypothetical protein